MEVLSSRVWGGRVKALGRIATRACASDSSLHWRPQSPALHRKTRCPTSPFDRLKGVICDSQSFQCNPQAASNTTIPCSRWSSTLPRPPRLHRVTFLAGPLAVRPGIGPRFFVNRESRARSPRAPPAHHRVNKYRSHGPGRFPATRGDPVAPLLA